MAAMERELPLILAAAPSCDTATATAPHSPPAGFWAAVAVWTARPQVANRRLSGCLLQAEREVDCSACGSAAAGLREVLAELLPGLEAEAGPGMELLLPPRVELLKVLLRTVIPKAGAATCTEIVLQDFLNNTATFIPIDGQIAESCTFRKNNMYRLKLRHDKEDESSWFISISILYPEEWDADGILYPKTAWLTDVLLTKIVKWSAENKKSYFKSTLSLIPVEKYSQYYHNLKAKYKEIVKIWPEVTNPEKFVYEDVAIATYLLILWEDERAEKGLTDKQSFIDLGCGNGLLVHILTNEGHPGRGIDVRKRKIWDMFGPQTRLEECAITPSDDFLFPEVDWLIGNHSDELTPWIPVVAARSSYSCRYFVLPCCFYDFYGKYCRREPKNTQYRAYLNFITEVGSVCGFKVEEDCLRIPSTKRVCLIGNQRTYPLSSEERLDEERTQYISERYSCTLSTNNHFSDVIASTSLHLAPDMKHCSNAYDSMVQDTSAEMNSLASSKWLAGFQPREKIQKVRNCATLPRDFTDDVVLQVAKELLKINQDSFQNSNDEDNTGNWNKGGSLPLKNVADLLDSSALQRLKNECGGLKTLLRNYCQVFEVARGQVQIRDWTKEKQTKKQSPGARKMPLDTSKSRLCWFFLNHPDGCPRNAEKCPFAHGTEELRPRTVK
ncbi:probable tRNA (uracil-O(2)-)-methyltransferase [Amblyraja radiata]|uniref:probable tRNA (uracil-O(2)-)-methyltransferase n=1 Tax=Amblyraja radiata TaxID=386614 RepID=UPI00140230B7|nr:probable tRNA (uracil-O(2)-)-methyltransferase [Amblyraja radiata]